MKAVVSNGSYKFHLAPLAAELARKGQLSAFFTAAYPKGAVRKWLNTIPLAGLQRLLDRQEDIPDALVHAFTRSDIFFKGGDLLLGRWSAALQMEAHIRGFESYAAQAARRLRRLSFDVYHYRNCYGLQSAEWAQRNGRLTVCDHSIAHPYAVSYVRCGQGAVLPEHLLPQPLNRLERYYLRDFDAADLVLVNSDFVKQTFVASGVDAGRVRVVYWGVDQQFLDAANHALSAAQKQFTTKAVFFAGRLEMRKGATDLMDALDQLADEAWTLTVAGDISDEVSERWRQFKARHPGRITSLGVLSRRQLADRMVRHPVFVFPSRLEGSARVVFEAMACGCFVVTTPNSGSVVVDGLNGAVISAEAPAMLAEALRRVWRGSYDLETISRYNRILVRETYRQDQYAAKVSAVYAFK